MTIELKFQIKELIAKFCEGYESQTRAAKALKNVSGGTISQILNDKWELISDKMWLNIGNQVGLKKAGWVSVETKNYTTITDLLTDAKELSRVHCIIGRASWGKDTGIKGFKATARNVFQVNCNKFLTDRYLMMELLTSMGEKASGTAYKMSERLVKTISQIEKPLIIINEQEKLAPTAFNYFITLYNSLEDKCGIVAAGTPYLKERVENGIKSGKQGYEEYFSRIGGKFVELSKPSRKDIKLICNANGVTDPETIAEIYGNAEGDLRRVKKLVQNKAESITQAEDNQDELAA